MTLAETLTEWKLRVATHKSVTAIQALHSMRPTDGRDLLRAKAAVQEQLGESVELYQTSRTFSRKALFFAFDRAIAAAEASAS